jgi:peptidoglycan/LPS O-acetylase OafA/YrhL
VPSLVDLLLHPERRRPSPPPLRVDLRRVILVGIAAWATALVVALAMLGAGAQDAESVAVCGAGLALGGLGLLWERRNRRRYRGED